MLKKIKVLTIFPKFFDQFSEYGVIGKAIKSKKLIFQHLILENMVLEITVAWMTLHTEEDQVWL